LIDADAGEVDILDVAQLQQVGGLLLQQLYRMKHNGAVEKTQIGLLTVCERLLRCSAPAINRLPGTWMQVRLLAAVPAALHLMVVWSACASSFHPPLHPFCRTSVHLHLLHKPPAPA
jgi:hypothetical protein